MGKSLPLSSSMVPDSFESCTIVRYFMDGSTNDESIFSLNHVSLIEFSSGDRGCCVAFAKRWPYYVSQDDYSSLRSRWALFLHAPKGHLNR